MSVIIRKALPQDYTPLCDLFAEVDELHRSYLPHLFRKPDGPVREYGYFLELLADEDLDLFLAQRGEELVGFIHAVVRDAPPIPVLVPHRFAFIDSIGVKSGCRKQRIGRLLMETVHAWAASKGAAAVELNVFEFNQTAIAFYRELGYATLRRRMVKPLNHG